MSSFGSTPPTLIWPRLSHGGKATALNEALVQIDTDTVLTVDGDMLLEHDPIDAVRRAF
jgi:cellulose synthase/poly-beta-1,6-N-acetylglucosamine synthase-like glycosyltransferase